MVRQGPAVLSVVFDDVFENMSCLLRRSLNLNSPGCSFEVVREEPPRQTKWMPKFITDNLRKLELWKERVDEGAEGEELVLIDADTLVLRDLRDAFDVDFDLRYTIRPGRVPFNCGVVFVRVNDKSRRFFAQWVKHNQRIVKNQGLSLEHLREFAGGNQWALNEVLSELDAGKFPCRVETAPCEIWNCEQETWERFSTHTAVLHIKSWLRAHLLNHLPFENDRQRVVMAPILKVCRAYGW